MQIFFLHIKMRSPFKILWTGKNNVFLLRKAGQSLVQGILHFIASVTDWHRYFLEELFLSLNFLSFSRRKNIFNNPI